MKMRNELNRHLYVQKTSNIERLPYNVEQGQYADICSGDMEAVERGLSVMEQRIFLRQLSDDPARNALLHLVIVASDTAKACVDSGMGHDEAYTLADIYIRKADKCRTEKAVSYTHLTLPTNCT